MDQLIRLILESVIPGQVKILAILILVNMGTGVLSALMTKTFEMVKMLEIWKRLGLYFGAYLMAAVLAVGIADFEPLLFAIFTAEVGILSSKILLNLKEGFPDLPIPASFANFVEKKLP